MSEKISVRTEPMTGPTVVYEDYIVMQSRAYGYHVDQKPGIDSIGTKVWLWRGPWLRLV